MHFKVLIHFLTAIVTQVNTEFEEMYLLLLCVCINGGVWVCTYHWPCVEDRGPLCEAGSMLLFLPRLQE